jgi:molecular chaperone GrpE
MTPKWEWSVSQRFRADAMTMHDPRSDSMPIETGTARADQPANTDGYTERPATDLEALLQKAEAEAAELKDAWLRARADVENIRRQSQADLARATKFAIEKFATDLLPVRDALEQSLAVPNASAESLKTGAELTLKNLQAAFARANVQEVDPVGEKFDPHRHQAMQMVPSDQPANTVVTVYQKGYVLNDRVLRPAMVTVSQGPRQT